MPAAYSDSGEDRKPGWVFSRHPSHQPYIALDGDTLDPNQNLPDRSDLPLEHEQTTFSFRLINVLAIGEPLADSPADSSHSCWAMERGRLR